MEIKQKENNCGCNSNDDSCCQPTPKKKNVFGKIVFAAVIAIATGMIIFKVFIQEPETTSNKDATECCPGGETGEASSCCSKEKVDE